MQQNCDDKVNTDVRYYVPPHTGQTAEDLANQLEAEASKYHSIPIQNDPKYTGTVNSNTYVDALGLADGCTQSEMNIVWSLFNLDTKFNFDRSR